MHREEICACLVEAARAVGNSPSHGDSLLRLLTVALQTVTRRDFPAMLTIWAAQAAGQPSSLTMDSAAAWLGMYVAAKLLDDLQDGDYSFVGEDISPSVATNLALVLIFAAQKCLVGNENMGDAARRVQLLEVISDASLRMIAGQQACLQLNLEGDPLRTSWAVARAKGGIPFSVACRMGAMSVGADGQVVDALGQYGEHIGEAIQAIDDANGILAQEVADLSSPSGSLALAYALAVAEGEDRETLQELMSQHRAGESGAAEQIWALLESMGCLRYLSVEATVRVARARKILTDLGSRLRPEGVISLLELANWLDPTATGVVPRETD